MFRQVHVLETKKFHMATYLRTYSQMEVPLAVLNTVLPLAIVNVAIGEIKSPSTMFLVVDPTSFVD